MITEFWVTLEGAKYGENGWPCSALSIPGARCERVVPSGGGSNWKELVEFRAGQLRFHAVPKPVPDVSVLVVLEKRLFAVDNAIVVAMLALIGVLATAYATYLGSVRSGERASICLPPPVEIAPVVQALDALPGGSRSRAPNPSLSVPSLVDAFNLATAEPFAGLGTVNPPNCNWSNGTVTIAVPAQYQQYAGCYLSLPKATDLTPLLNGVVKISLARPSKDLEIKLEGGPSGQGRAEWLVFLGKAPAGPSEYRLQNVPKMVLQNARRLTFALRDDPPTANTIVVQP